MEIGSLITCGNALLAVVGLGCAYYVFLYAKKRFAEMEAHIRRVAKTALTVGDVRQIAGIGRSPSPAPDPPPSGSPPGSPVPGAQPSPPPPPPSDDGPPSPARSVASSHGWVVGEQKRGPGGGRRKRVPAGPPPSDE